MNRLDPSPILQTAFGFWNSKVLLTAVEMGLFSKLGSRRLAGADLGAELGLHPRGISDFFDALVAMRFLDREGIGPAALYFNTPEGAMYLEEKSPRYIGGILTMLNVRLFKYWHDLPQALRTGRPQNEVKSTARRSVAEMRKAAGRRSPPRRPSSHAASPSATPSTRAPTTRKSCASTAADASPRCAASTPWLAATAGMRAAH